MSLVSNNKVHSRVAKFTRNGHPDNWACKKSIWSYCSCLLISCRHQASFKKPATWEHNIINFKCGPEYSSESAPFFFPLICEDIMHTKGGEPKSRKDIQERTPLPPPFL